MLMLERPLSHFWTSLLNVAMVYRNYFRPNNLQILKLATYTKIEDHYSWQLFGLERIAKRSDFILSTQNIKFYWFVMKIKKFLLPIRWYNRGLFPLENKYFWVFVLHGLKEGHHSVRGQVVNSRQLSSSGVRSTRLRPRRVAGKWHDAAACVFLWRLAWANIWIRESILQLHISWLESRRLGYKRGRENVIK